MVRGIMAQSSKAKTSKTKTTKAAKSKGAKRFVEPRRRGQNYVGQDGAKPSKQARELGRALYERRRELNLSQVAVAKQVGCRPNYIGYLEIGVRHPSQDMVFRLAGVLHLDPHELLLLANPLLRGVTTKGGETESPWDEFRANKKLHSRHAISDGELKALNQIAMLGTVRHERDVLFILETMRRAFDKTK